MGARLIRDWTDSEKIDKLTAFEEVFFIRLCMKADDMGYYQANPKILRSALFPLKENIETILIENCVEACESAGLIETYNHEGKRYLKIHKFGQRLRKMKSKFPINTGEGFPEKKNETKLVGFFHLDSQAIYVPVSEYIKTNFASFIEQWVMKHNNDAETLNSVFERMDTEYHSTTFYGNNHVKNAFTHTWKTLENERQSINGAGRHHGKKDYTSKQSDVAALAEMARANLKAIENANSSGSDQF